jgi:hypothetical protein
MNLNDKPFVAKAPKLCPADPVKSTNMVSSGKPCAPYILKFRYLELLLNDRCF